jgi:hypothetical protein
MVTRVPGFRVDVRVSDEGESVSRNDPMGELVE